MLKSLGKLSYQEEYMAKILFRWDDGKFEDE